MNESQNNNNESLFARLGRNLGQSRTGQFFVAITVATFALALSYVSWIYRDLAAVILAISLALYGLRVAWRILPIPASTRARWARERQIAQGCPVGRRYPFFLGYGIGLLISKLLHHKINANLAPFDFVFPCFLIAIGSIQYLVVRRYIRNVDKATKQGRGDS